MCYLMGASMGQWLVVQSTARYYDDAAGILRTLILQVRCSSLSLVCLLFSGSLIGAVH
jgi:hypothetical protein